MPLPFNQLLDVALNLIFPINCLGCGSEGAYVCDHCLKELPWLRPPCCFYCAAPQSGTPCRWCRHRPLALDGITAAFLMEGAIREAVLQLKYHQVRGLAPVLSELMEHAWQAKGLPADLVLPVPLHPRRLRHRGYNQSALLSRALSKRLGLPCDESALVRTRDTGPQVGLSRDKRMLNVQDSFIGQEAVSGKAVLVVDDVATTCSTLSACADALRTAGATSVWGLVLAREAPPPAQGLHGSQPFRRPRRTQRATRFGDTSG